MSTTPLTLSIAGQPTPITLPQVPGSRGHVGVDIRELNQSGFCSYDPGFANTAGCQSAISWIDTENSVLLHRGYPVDQLARQCDFLEVAYIMLRGDAPDEASYQTFRETITRHTLVHEQIARMCSGFRRDSHPMALMCALVGALAAFYHDVLDVENPEHRALAATRLLSKMPTIAAMSYKYTIEQPAAYPRNDLSYAGNFLQMLFAIPAEKYVLNPVIEQAMNQILVLHADHGQCASTTTVRAAGSSGANLFACVAAGLASLWGPMHGGANESSMRMLEEIESVDQVPAFLRQAKRDPQAFRRLGFGNSRYRHRDPRADILRETSHRVLAEVGMSDRLLQVAMALEDVALTDPYFVENGLSPSVDFYTAVILKAMNLPSAMFAVVTAVGRTVGWVAHWNEMHQAPLTIYRPRQIYVGEDYRNYVSRRGEPPTGSR
ncbi:MULTISPECIES: citrate synthase [Klebsiella]|uniref:Citrate synthase n=1 Tax=Klebsiella quasipneumoniae subsp. quasipneumoniae TaxID=1667327 RepID=A0AAW8XPQ7_9ENTR|nr:citrate synthase [Klebsiella quasipneumoniae]ELT0943817.1 citrate synthase [Klebsiella quasipneumoniae]MBM5555584.1 citrate synthase [Klebsiella quasipneumoniae]MBM5563653.1 citrate synthase [Klebsiella quasipneumoniae]MCJ4452515.1 citrate synthase [Klebsiella quasipneumoniae]MDV0842228.1 citrate synthase [Klebsiella quasipneumoniae subsp. quasipneumoniae]